MVGERLESGEADDGFLLDGFPRTIGQAEMLEKTLKELGRTLTAVLLIDAPDDEVVRPVGSAHLREERPRLPRRVRSAQERGRVYDQDGSRLVQRDDDKPETVKKRLQVYHDQTEPLIERYEDSGQLRRFDGTRTPEEVNSHIRATLATLAMKPRSSAQRPRRDRARMGRRRQDPRSLPRDPAPRRGPA